MADPARSLSYETTVWALDRPWMAGSLILAAVVFAVSLLVIPPGHGVGCSRSVGGGR